MPEGLGNFHNKSSARSKRVFARLSATDPRLVRHTVVRGGIYSRDPTYSGQGQLQLRKNGRGRGKHTGPNWLPPPRISVGRAGVGSGCVLRCVVLSTQTRECVASCTCIRSMRCVFVCGEHWHKKAPCSPSSANRHQHVSYRFRCEPGSIQIPHPSLRALLSLARVTWCGPPGEKSAPMEGKSYTPHLRLRQPKNGEVQQTRPLLFQRVPIAISVIQIPFGHLSLTLCVQLRILDHRSGNWGTASWKFRPC